MASAVVAGAFSLNQQRQDAARISDDMTTLTQRLTKIEQRQKEIDSTDFAVYLETVLCEDPDEATDRKLSMLMDELDISPTVAENHVEAVGQMRALKAKLAGSADLDRRVGEAEEAVQQAREAFKQAQERLRKAEANAMNSSSALRGMQRTRLRLRELEAAWPRVAKAMDVIDSEQG